MTPTGRTATIDTPIGAVTVGATGQGVSMVHFGDPGSIGAPLGADRAVADAERADHLLGSALEQLGEYFAGVRTRFDLPLDLRGTEFQVAAWRALLNAPFGCTMSYAQQAAIIGRPRATRAVGGANARNPVAIVLPCHRVVGSNGSLTGFAGGTATKRWLLDHERRVMADSLIDTGSVATS